MATMNSINVQISATSLGSLNYPLQSCFLAYVSSSISSVTGDGTTYGPIIYDTTIFDQNSNFNTGTGNFTAPTTGRYVFHIGTLMTGLTALHTVIVIQLITTSNTYTVFDGNGSLMDAANQLIYPAVVYANMTSGDTAYVSIQISNGTKVVSIGSAGSDNPMESFFCGTLLG